MPRRKKETLQFAQRPADRQRPATGDHGQSVRPIKANTEYRMDCFVLKFILVVVVLFFNEAIRNSSESKPRTGTLRLWPINN